MQSFAADAARTDGQLGGARYGCVSGTACPRSAAEASTGRELPAATATKTAAPPKGRHHPSGSRPALPSLLLLHARGFVTAQELCNGGDRAAPAGGTGGGGGNSAAMAARRSRGAYRPCGPHGVSVRVLLARSARFSPRRASRPDARPRSVLAARRASTWSPGPRCGCQSQRRPAARDQGVQALQARRELRSRASGGVPELILAEAARPPPPGT